MPVVPTKILIVIDDSDSAFRGNVLSALLMPTPTLTVPMPTYDEYPSTRQVRQTHPPKPPRNPFHGVRR